MADEAKQEIKQELIELEHNIKNGVMVIGGTAYEIVKGKVKVAAEHLDEAIKHIKMSK